MAFPLRLLLIFAVCACGLAHAADERNLGMTAPGKRVALVIGNSAYASAPLKNPVNDAKDMAAALRKLGFEVIDKTDATQKDMNLAIAQFGDKLRADTVALFFFAGHGMQVKGKNYIVPIDAQITSESTVRAMTVDVDTVMDQLAVSTMNIVILDACRNNPFERKFRSTGGGLAQMDAPKGSLIAYATAPGKVANDGDGRNGLYTQELLKHIQTPGIPLESVFKRVRNGVMQGSSEAQTPWEASSLTGDFYFQARTVTQGTQVASLGAQIVGGRTREQIEDELWDAIRESSKASVFEEYLKQYPKGRYLAQARVKIAALKDLAKPPTPSISSFTSPANTDPDTALWIEVQKGNTADDYDVYLSQYPKGKYVALAKKRIQKLSDDVRQQVDATEQSAWRAAEGAQTVDGYAAYLASFPNGRYTALAQTRSNKLKNDAATQAAQRERAEREAAEEGSWRKAEAGSSLGLVSAYLAKYPTGKFASSARIKLAQIEKEVAEMKPGQVIKDCADCPEMIVIPVGDFDMGGNGKYDGKPIHHVAIKAFAMGKTELTYGQWRTIMGEKYSARAACDDRDSCPTGNVKWNDAQEFVRKLNEKTGKTYRLPSEAEWEYACRAGSSHQYCGSDEVERVAWTWSTWRTNINPAARKQANAWGLYDMSGNVMEWVEDCWNNGYGGAPADGSAWTSGNCQKRMMRGGSVSFDYETMGSAVHFFSLDPASSTFTSGFRLARDLP